MITVRVPLGDRSYEVLVGPGVRSLLAEKLPLGVRRVAVVTSEEINVDVSPGVPAEVVLVPPGEESKSLATVEELCRRFARFGLTRSDAVVAVGGGLITDVAGFAAAVYHRGVRAVFVPTSLLAQIDAAIGGKTGVNLPEGKNLVGAFWQPSAVLCDTETLESLPEREFLSGKGEMAKYHFLGGAGLDGLPLVERIARCVEIKARFVAEDEREGGGRALLNYGHTLAHALEVTSGFGLRHGEAVAIGLIFAAEVAHGLGRIDRARVEEHYRVVSSYKLLSRLPEDAKAEELLALFRRDKKAVEGLTMVLDGPGGLELVQGIPDKILTESLESIR